MDQNMMDANKKNGQIDLDIIKSLVEKSISSLNTTQMKSVELTEIEQQEQLEKTKSMLENFNKTQDMIRNAPGMNIPEKINLQDYQAVLYEYMEQKDTEREIELMKAKTQCTVEATNAWGKNLALVGGVVFGAFGLFFGIGRLSRKWL